MKILFHIPSTNTIYAGRTIYHGYKNAFLDMGHEFKELTADDDFKQTMEKYSPDILMTSLNNYYLRYLDLDVLGSYRKNGLKVLVNIPFWDSPLSKLRVNETPGLKDTPDHIKLLVDNRLGDIFYNVCEQDDHRMAGFTKTTGLPYYTIPLAADHLTLKPTIDPRFASDIAYIGTYLPAKRKFFKEQVFPLKKQYDLKLYGQDWTAWDRSLGLVQKIGQYFNIPGLKTIQKPKLQLNDEAKIYRTAKISINVHEDYQKKYGGDCNERTFKIPLCGGLEITDNVACIAKYFVPNQEMIIANNKSDWFDKIDHYIHYPEEAKAIISAGRARVLKEHTYTHRAQKLIDLSKTK